MAISARQFESKKAVLYKSIRSKLVSGDLLLCSGRAASSKLIQKATNSPLSHVAFVIRVDDIDRVMVMESVESQGVRTVPLSHYLKNYGGNGKPYKGRLYIGRHTGLASLVKKKPKLLREMTQMAVDRFGYLYDKDEIVKIAGRIGLGLFGLKSNARLTDDQEYICSEYVWLIYKYIKINAKNATPGFIAPADFAKDENVCLKWRLL